MTTKLNLDNPSPRFAFQIGRRSKEFGVDLHGSPLK